MAPVNFLDRSLIGHALCERERPLRNRSWRFGMKESQQCAAQDRTGDGRANKEGE
jgi:hypothetical protein